MEPSINVTVCRNIASD